jgi:hypothetical protein
MPKYRALRDHVFINSVGYLAGNVLEHRGWPRWNEGDAEPIDDEAKEISRWFAKNGNEVLRLPPTPFDDAGNVYLPANCIDWRSTRLPGVDREQPTMPRYRVLARSIFVGPTEHHKGDEVTFCGWPPAFALEPLNEPAKAVAAYFAEHSAHPQLPRSPWNEFAGGSLYLPELPAHRPGPADITPAPSPAPRKARAPAYNPLA